MAPSAPPRRSARRAVQTRCASVSSSSIRSSSACKGHRRRRPRALRARRRQPQRRHRRQPRQSRRRRHQAHRSAGTGSSKPVKLAIALAPSSTVSRSRATPFRTTGTRVPPHPTSASSTASKTAPRASPRRSAATARSIPATRATMRSASRAISARGAVAAHSALRASACPERRIRTLELPPVGRAPSRDRVPSRASARAVTLWRRSVRWARTRGSSFGAEPPRKGDSQ